MLLRLSSLALTGMIRFFRLLAISNADKNIEILRGRPAWGVDAAPSLYRGHRFLVEIINHCVWLYYRFLPSLRDIEEMMAQRGVIVSSETIHQWCRRTLRTEGVGH